MKVGRDGQGLYQYVQEDVWCAPCNDHRPMNMGTFVDALIRPYWMVSSLFRLQPWRVPMLNGFISSPLRHLRNVYLYDENLGDPSHLLPPIQIIQLVCFHRLGRCKCPFVVTSVNASTHHYTTSTHLHTPVRHLHTPLHSPLIRNQAQSYSGVCQVSWSLPHTIPHLMN